MAHLHCHSTRSQAALMMSRSSPLLNVGFRLLFFCVFSPLNRPPSLPSSHPPYSVSIFLPFFIYNLPHTPSFSNSIAVSCFGRTCWAGAKAIMRTVRRRQMNRWEKKRGREGEVKGGRGRDMNMKQWHCAHYWQFTHACLNTRVRRSAAAWAYEKLPGKEGSEDGSIHYINAEASEWSSVLKEAGGFANQ